MNTRVIRTLQETQQDNIQPASRMDLRDVPLYESKWSPLMQNLWDKPTSRDKRRRQEMAIIYETTARVMDRRRLVENATTTSNVAHYGKFVFPALRWAVPNMVTPELVSHQPITSAHANVFFFDTIMQAKGSVAAGSTFPQAFNPNYSTEFIDGEVIGLGDGTNFGGGGTALAVTLAWVPVWRPDTARGTVVEIQEVDANGNVVQTGTATTTGGFTGGLTAGSINFNNGAITGLRFTNIPASGNVIKCYYSYTGEANREIPTLQGDMRRHLMIAKTRRLKTVLSVEAAIEYQDEHGIDILSELTQSAASELSLGTDREVVEQLFRASYGTTTAWSKVPPSGISEVDHYSTLFSSFSEIGYEIAKKTLRGRANWAIVSTKVAGIMEQCQKHGDFKPLFSQGMAPESTEDKPLAYTGEPHGQFGIQKIGVIPGKMTVYVDPFFHADFALLGLKGSNYMDSGFVLSPYIPFLVLPPLLDPNDGTYRSQVLSKYGMAMLRPQYYGHVRVTG